MAPTHINPTNVWAASLCGGRTTKVKGGVQDVGGLLVKALE
jgi:hypothetical protein